MAAKIQSDHVSVESSRAYKAFQAFQLVVLQIIWYEWICETFSRILAWCLPVLRPRYLPHRPNQPENAVLISGASTGLGKAVVLDLIKEGYTVLAGVRKREDGESLRLECADKGSTSDRLIPVLWEVTDDQQTQQVHALVKRVLEQRQLKLSALILNAGISGFMPLELEKMLSAEKTFEVNTLSIFRALHSFLPLLRESQGRIMVTGSINGSTGIPGMASYSASKFAVEGLCDSLRLELMNQGIPVILLKPGTFRTKIFEKVGGLSGTGSPSPDLVSPNYQSLLSLSVTGPKSQFKRGSDPALFARCVRHALVTEYPQTRYWIGLDAWLIWLGRTFLPDLFWDAVLRGGFAVQQWAIDREEKIALKMA